MKAMENPETTAPKTEAVVKTETSVAPEAEGANSQEKAPLTQEEQELLVQSEKTIQVGLGQFFDVGSALILIRDRELHREGFDTFEDYCRQRWNLSDKYAYRLINAAECVTALRAELTAQGVTIFPSNESQARPLLDLDSKKWAKAWLKVLKDTEGRQITAKEVQAAVDKLEGKPKGEKTVTPKDKLAKTERKLTKIGNLVAKVLDHKSLASNSGVRKLLEDILKVIKRGQQ